MSGLRTFDRDALTILNLLYRVPGLIPQPVYPATADVVEEKAVHMVEDELIRVLRFVPTDPDGRPFSHHYQVKAKGRLEEPPLATTGSGSEWKAGATTPFGQALEALFDAPSTVARFKKGSLFVRADELMVDPTNASQDVLEVQVRLASIALVRALSLAILQSRPLPRGDLSIAATGTGLGDDAAEFTGLPAYIAGTEQEIDWRPVPGMMGGLAAIEARCHSSGGDFGTAPDAFVMSSRARWRLLSEMEQRGLTPQYLPSALTGKPQLHFHGIPVLTGRVREEPSGGTTEAWALKLTGPTAVRVLHVGGKPGSFGVQLEPTTVTQAAAASTDGQPAEVQSSTRGVEIFGNYSLCVPEPQSAARLTGIPVDEPTGTFPIQ